MQRKIATAVCHLVPEATRLAARHFSNLEQIAFLLALQGFYKASFCILLPGSDTGSPDSYH